MKVKLSYKQLFLLDGLGAVVTALMLAAVLPLFKTAIGVPLTHLHGLAIGAAGLAVYSFSCYALLARRWQPYLKIIAVLNTLYCVLTFSMVVYLWGTITWLGVAYFLGEIALVQILVRLEWQKATAPNLKT